MLRMTVRALAVAALLVLVSSALAQSGGPYDLSWNSVDGGGETECSGGGYTLGGTIGQPDAGLMAGGVYTLGGGFWGGGSLAVQEHTVYLPLVMRNY